LEKNAYMGVSSVARKIKQPNIGVSGLDRIVSNGYIGVSGISREFYTSNKNALACCYPSGGTSIVYYSLDGGASWSSVSNGPIDIAYNGCFYGVRTTNTGSLYFMTSETGAEWNSVCITTSANFYSYTRLGCVKYGDEVFIAYHNSDGRGTIYYSSNGGSTFTLVSDTLTEMVSTTLAYDGTTLVSGYYTYQYYYYSKDKGKSWAKGGSIGSSYSDIKIIYTGGYFIITRVDSEEGTYATAYYSNNIPTLANVGNAAGSSSQTMYDYFQLPQYANGYYTAIKGNSAGQRRELYYSTSISSAFTSKTITSLSAYAAGRIVYDGEKYLTTIYDGTNSKTSCYATTSLSTPFTEYGTIASTPYNIINLTYSADGNSL